MLPIGIQSGKAWTGGRLEKKALAKKRRLTSCELLFCDIKVLREKKSVHEKGNTGTGLSQRVCTGSGPLGAQN